MESQIFSKLSSLQVRVGLFFCFPMHNGESITSNFFTVRCLLMLHDTAATNSCKSLTLLDFRLIKQHQWRKSQSISDILLSEALEYKWPHLGLLAPLHSRFAASIFAVHTKIAIQWRRKYQDWQLLLSNLCPWKWPPCTWAWAGWCVQIGPCSSPWHRTKVGRARRCPFRPDPSRPSNIVPRPADQASDDRRPTFQSVCWWCLITAWTVEAWKNKESLRCKRRTKLQ